MVHTNVVQYIAILSWGMIQVNIGRLLQAGTVCPAWTGHFVLIVQDKLLLRERWMGLLACLTSTTWPFSLSCSCWASTSLNFALDASSANALFCCFKVRTCSRSMQQAADQGWMQQEHAASCWPEGNASLRSRHALQLCMSFVHTPTLLHQMLGPSQFAFSKVLLLCYASSAQLCMHSSDGQPVL